MPRVGGRFRRMAKAVPCAYAYTRGVSRKKDVARKVDGKMPWRGTNFVSLRNIKELRPSKNSEVVASDVIRTVIISVIRHTA